MKKALIYEELKSAYIHGSPFHHSSTCGIPSQGMEERMLLIFHHSLQCSPGFVLNHFFEGVIADHTSLAMACTSSVALCTTPGAFTSVSAVKSSLFPCDSVLSSAL
ncbi:hypothetical protein KC19_8G064300, partial [Ceratodon purpureus]